MTARRRPLRLLRLLRVWGPAAALMAAIFFVSGMSSPPLLPDSTSEDAPSDVTAHFLVYVALGGALLRGVSGAEWARVTATGALLAALLGAVYGLTDEFHQSFVRCRTAELRDVAADALGSAAGAGLGWAWSIVLAVRAGRHAA